MALSYPPGSFPSGPRVEPSGKRSALRGPKRTGPIRAIVPGDDVEVAREIARLWDLVAPRSSRRGGAAQKIIEVDEVVIGSEPTLDFRTSATVMFTGENDTPLRDIIMAHALFVNPGDIQIDPEFAACWDGYFRESPLTDTFGNSVFGTIVDGSQFVVGTEGASQTGFILQYRVVTEMGANISNLIAYVNGSQAFVWTWDPGESPSTFDSGWVTPSQSLSGDQCDEIETQLTFVPHNTTFGSTVGDNGTMYSRWVYAPSGSEAELQDILPPGDEEGQIIVWDNDDNLWRITLSTIANARHKLRVNGGVTRSRQRYNFIAGPGIKITGADDSTNEEVDITIRASLAAGSGDAVGVSPPSAVGDILVAVGASPTDPVAFMAQQDALGASSAWDLQDGAAATTAADRIASETWATEIGNAFQADPGPETSDESMRLAGNGFNQSAFGTADDDFSFDFWAKITNAANAQNYLFSPGFSKWACYVDSSGVLGVLVQGVGFFSSGGSNIEDSLWHHIAVVREGGEWFFYVDGQLDGSVASALTGAPSGTAALGQDTAGGNSPSGFMAYAAYYDTTVLLASEIEELYQAMLGGVPALSWQVLPAGSVGDVLTIGAGGEPEWA